MADWIGQQVGNYRITAKLGSGGFAAVYLGEHAYLKTPAAIKLLLTKVATQKELDAFLQEAQTVACLLHPNIVRILDFGIDDKTPFLIMDYAPKGTLRQLHSRGTRLPLSTIVSYVKQVANALQYAHNEKFIHRDIKPENMLLGRSDEILLSDFGIALIVQATSDLSTQNIAGTAAYMSPEQIRGKPRFASDQYSLGVVVYEWISGDHPFLGNFAELCAQHISVPPPPLREKVPALRPEVEKVILKALAKQPEQRFKNVEAFAFALADACQLPAAPFVSPIPITPLRNDQSEEPTPQSNSFEQLWREAVQAQARGEEEQAFHSLRKIITMGGLTPSQIETAKTQIRSLRQLIPVRLQQARDAASQARWQDEMQAWQDLLILEPLRQEIAGQLVLEPTESVAKSIQERLCIAQQNEQATWMYTQAQQFVHERDNAAARMQLEMLWRNALYYGDPAGLAQIVGLPLASNYEQALDDHLQEQAELRAQRMQKEAERRNQALAQRMQKEREEKRGLTLLVTGALISMITGIVVGAIIGAIEGNTGGGIVVGAMLGVTVGILVGAVVVMTRKSTV
ncbi:MAG TPA: protein kinase [Ktedonobacteraceae bacterium]|nr:protein kinase [Ktedonobacteraceae bacterium]